jgi:hypothetical protein
MQTFKAKVVTDNIMILSDVKSLEQLYNVIVKEEDFIVEWVSKEGNHAKVIIGASLISKIRAGDVQLVCEGGLKC